MKSAYLCSPVLTKALNKYCNENDEKEIVKNEEKILMQ
jgi:hypothetical protein